LYQTNQLTIIDRVSHINALISQKNNETHITYRRLAEIESLCEGAIRKEEELKSQTNTFVPNKMQRMIDDLKSEIGIGVFIRIH
jgi:hypothetical protein